MINPWPGLASYTEDSKDIFYGRSAESATLSALIRRNLFVTLYGRSGIGKTSLLQAGVFPLLRGDNSLCPIRIRLKEIKSEVEENKAKTEIKGKRNKKQTNESKEEVVTEDSKEKEAAPAAELLWGKVIDELKKEGVEYLPCDENDMYEPEFSDVMVLRNIFSAGRFWKTDNNEEIIPVIVIDQFEEVLYKAPKASRLLVSQLQALIDDNYDLTIPHPTWHEDTIFRIVVSIREDDLFLFEDCIDKLNCVDLKSNRYRLMPLTREEAEEVVTSPASAIEMFKADEKEEIVKKIIKISCNIGENVNTLMLSLICHVLYDKYVKEGKAISEAVLAQFDDIIILYYLSVLTEKKLPKREIEWFEDNLIDEQGRRKSVYESDFEKFAPNALQSEKNEYSDGNHQHNPDKSEKNDTIEANTDTKSHANTNNNQLFNISQGRVEFIHDQLAASVFEVRNSRKSKKYLRNSLILMVVALAALFSYSITQFPEPKELKKEIVSSKELVDLANNTKVIEYTIDSIDSRSYNQDYEINDCPNLKTINIGKRYARVNLYHCPSLVTINYPADFKGIVRVYNCPNLISSDEHCSSISIYGRDTAYLSEYGSPYEQSCISAKRYDKQISICDPNICVWNSLPYFCYRDNQGIYYMDRIITGIPIQ